MELTDLVNSIIISNDLTQIVYFPTHIPDCDSYSPAILDLFLFSEASICSAMAFPQLENSDHVVSVSIQFPINSKQDALFHRVAYDYSRADWDSLCNHLRDVPWEDIFKLLLVNFVSGFRLELYISHCKHQVKPHSSP